MNVLVVAWDSGGGVEVVNTVVKRTVARGHRVRVLGTEGLRTGVESAGATFRPYRYAPDNDRSRAETDLVKDWEAKGPLDAFARIRDRVMFGPARLFARDVMEELERETADVVVVDVLIASALCGAEAAGVPRVLLMHALYGIPRPGAPPMGAGFLPSSGVGGRLRDRAVTGLTLKLFATGLPPLNEARVELGLDPYDSPLELFDNADRIVVCTSPSFDFAADTVPDNVRYVGPQFDDPGPEPWSGPWADSSSRPLVLVGLSSTFMDQQPLLQNAAHALGRLPVHGLITTGSAVDPAGIVAPANVMVTDWVRHADVLPDCATVVTHGGHGTVMKSLRAGVPVVVAPLGRDQPDNAARVVHAEAGVRVGKGPSVGRLERAIARALWEPTIRAGAARMADRLASERDDGLVVDQLEEVAAAHPRRPPTVARLRPLDELIDAEGSGVGLPPIELPPTVSRRLIEMSDGGRIEVFESGTGPPMVLLHGMGLSADIWARQFPDLAEEHRVIAWNQRGCGESTPGTEGFGLDRLVEDLVTMLAALDVHGAVLVGHSLGGMVAIEAATARPQDLAGRIRGLVVVSTTGGAVPPIGDSAVKTRLFDAAMAMEDRWHISTRFPAVARVGARLSFGRGHGEADELALVRRALEASDPAAGPELIALLSTYDSRDRLASLDLPVRVVIGAWDSFIPEKDAAQLASRLPNARLVTFPRAGHMLMLERSDEFNTLLHEFSVDPATKGLGPPSEVPAAAPEPAPFRRWFEPMGAHRPGMRRLNGEDSGFLSLELPTQPMTSQFVVVLQPGVGSDGRLQPITLNELRRHLGVRLGELPAFRWRILRVPLGLSHHVAIEDPDFSIDRHLAQVNVEPGSGDDGFARICDQLSERCLDRSRPLWELVLVDGLEGGRQGLVIRFHHALMDGLPTLVALSRILSGVEHRAARPAEPWNPIPVPTKGRLLGDAIVEEGRIRRRLPSLVVRTWRGYRAQQAFERSSPVAIAVSPKDTPVCSLNDAFSGRRTHANLDLSLTDILAVKREAGVTINQVVLALVAGGLRRYLLDRADLPDTPLICGVPMAFNPPGAIREFGNHFINFVTSLATTVEDPWERLQAIGEASTAARRSMEEFGAETLCEWLDQVPPSVSERLVRRHVRSRRENREVADINVNVSLVRALDEPWALGSATVEGVYLQGPPNSGFGLSVTALSYGDKLMVGLHACAEALPDPRTVARGMEAELVELVEMVREREPSADRPLA
jgi:diacylglycerol O-acyltransferase